ncbi:MAG: EutN/CcmL family microcompartment protein [Hespellia sp.]|nr:EutN/CcmL family microcompartment protein [Hespellia sp.]
MYIARVIGTVVSTSKQDSLIGMKFLVIERLDEHLQRIGESEIAVDSVGAGTGEMVIVCKGSAARTVLGGQVPVDTSIVGIIDTVEVG